MSFPDFVQTIRLWVGIVGLDGGVDGALAFSHAFANAATNALIGDRAKPALGKIEPRRRSGNKAEVKALAFGEPVFDVLYFMGRVVVGDAANVRMFRRGAAATKLVVPLRLQSWVLVPARPFFIGKSSSASRALGDQAPESGSPHP